MATRIVMAPQRAQWPVPLPWSYSLGDNGNPPELPATKNTGVKLGAGGGLAPSTRGRQGPRPCPHVRLGPGSLLHLSEHSSLTPLSLKTSVLCLPVCVCPPHKSQTRILTSSPQKTVTHSPHPEKETHQPRLISCSHLGLIRRGQESGLCKVWLKGIRDIVLYDEMCVVFLRFWHRVPTTRAIS